MQEKERVKIQREISCVCVCVCVCERVCEREREIGERQRNK